MINVLSESNRDSAYPKQSQVAVLQWAKYPLSNFGMKTGLHFQSISAHCLFYFDGLTGVDCKIDGIDTKHSQCDCAGISLQTFRKR